MQKYSFFYHYKNNRNFTTKKSELTLQEMSKELIVLGVPALLPRSLARRRACSGVRFAPVLHCTSLSKFIDHRIPIASLVPVRTTFGALHIPHAQNRKRFFYVKRLTSFDFRRLTYNP